MKFTLILLCFSLFACSQPKDTKPQTPKKTNLKLQQYIAQHKNNKTPSQSIGSVSNGTLKNGKLIPYKGSNFCYFDETSYLSGRAFTNEKVLKTILSGYKKLESLRPSRKFQIMECSHQHGGKLWPHRTHQNGLSVDFMMPKLKNSKPYYKLDSLGTNHYWLTFDDNGKYEKDTTISLDFELIAQHLLVLQAEAKKQHLKIAKVIIKIELKEELFKGHYGQLLEQSGIYIVKSLTPTINNLHDEHYHVDFKEVL